MNSVAVIRNIPPEKVKWLYKIFADIVYISVMAINKSGRAENILFYIPYYIHYINITSVGTIIYKEHVKLHSYLLNDIKFFYIHLSELIKIKESTCMLNTLVVL